jgi:hypothetical protein
MGVASVAAVAINNFAFAACEKNADGTFKAVVDIETGKPCTSTDLWTVISTGINFLLIAIGTLSVVMIIVGGIRYVTSGGNDKSVASAKNTILYAIIGLVIAGLAGAIVNFVLKNALSIQK